MEILKGNIFKDPPLNEFQPESFETLVKTMAIHIERIVTNPHFQAPGQWFDQENDEWVLLAEGEAEIELITGEIIKLKKGDYFLIPSLMRHRLYSVSNNPGCVWLGIHADMK